jgi:hypothetical protein
MIDENPTKIHTMKIFPDDLPIVRYQSSKRLTSHKPDFVKIPDTLHTDRQSPQGAMTALLCHYQQTHTI